MPIRKTGALPEPIDRQVNEIIRAFSEMEEQVRQIIKASDQRIGDNAEYIDRHVRNLNNPHSVTAKQVKALPLAFVLDPSSICFPFQNSLVSTRGETPIGLYGSSITDYGLVTGNGLCATLLPEGGVAVTEGTTNLIPSNRLKFEEWAVYEGASVTVEQGHSIPGITLDGATRIQTSGGTHVVKYVISVGTGAAGTPASYRVWVRNIGDKPVSVYGNAISVSNIVYPGETKLCTGSTDAVSGTAARQIQFRALDVDDSLDLIAYQPQIEEKPFATPFVEGTRPAGQLSIPLIKERHSAGNITLSTILTCNGDDYYVDVSTILRVINTDANNAGFYIRGTGPSGGNKLKLSYLLGEQLADLYTNISAKNGTKQKLTLVVDGREVYLYQDGSLLWSGTIPEWGTAVTFNRVQFMGVKSQTYENTLISPSVVSPETVATWHSLDAPFIDPFIPPSQGVPYFNTPDEFSNSTANFAMVNVDGLVKLYARTPDKTIIIETLGNTEVV